jgi:DNA-binding transcriptional MerR regulator
MTADENPRRDLVSIGRFAALTGISAKTLRRYDKSGMLAAAFVDPFTGYRLYSLEQLDVAVMIHLLRELDMPLAEVGDLVSSGDTDRMRQILRGHRRQVAARLAETQRILTRLDDALHEVRGLMPYEVDRVDLDPLWVVSCRASTTRPQIDAAYERCVAAIDAALTREKLAAGDREVVLYHNVLQWYEGLDMEVCMPVEPRDPVPPAVWRLAGGAAARTVYRGPWEADIWPAYAVLLSWIVRHGYEPCGPAREFYVVDERDTDDPSRYVTQLTWTVREHAAP